MASPSGMSTGFGLLVTSCAGPGRPPGAPAAEESGMPPATCVFEPVSSGSGVAGEPTPWVPVGGGTCHPETVFPAALLNRCERTECFALSRENLMTWYCGSGYSPVASPPSATPPARPEIAHPSEGAQAHPQCPGTPFQEGPALGTLAPAEHFLRNPTAQAPLGRGVPACTDGQDCAVVHKIGTGICHRMTSGPDLCEWAVQGLVLAVPVNLTCAPRCTSVTS